MFSDQNNFTNMMNLQYIKYFFRITEDLWISKTVALEGINFNGIFWGRKALRTLKCQNIKSPNPLVICQRLLAVKAKMEGKVYVSNRRVISFV